MDYAIVPFLASGMVRNFADCALTLPFNSRHVVELHGFPNDGCQVCRSGQARVASQQTNGPRTKLGYDCIIRTLTDVHHVPELKKNLVFVGAMD